MSRYFGDTTLVTLLSVFVDEAYEVRSGWKVAAYTALLSVLLVGCGGLLGLVVYATYPDWLEASRIDIRLLGLNAAVLFLPAVGAMAIMARFVDRVPLDVFGVTLHERWGRDFVVGIAIAAGMLAIMLAGSALFGSVRMEWTFTTASLPGIAITLAVLVVSAANEELIFRGYPLQVLLRGIGPWAAVILISCAFGFVHKDNANATWLSIVNTILAGVFLSLAYLKTRSLWLPLGIHFGWNSGLAVVLGFPVSGMQTASILTTHVTGPSEILGGGYGPEGGYLGTVIFLAATVVVYKLSSVTISPRLRATLAANEGKVWIG
jgi:membrane protease YdiL (CAAX protease family)